MHVYFYHTQNIQYCLDRMKDGEFPSHFLYGACHLGQRHRRCLAPFAEEDALPYSHRH